MDYKDCRHFVSEDDTKQNAVCVWQQRWCSKQRRNDFTRRPCHTNKQNITKIWKLFTAGTLITNFHFFIRRQFAEVCLLLFPHTQVSYWNNFDAWNTIATLFILIPGTAIPDNYFPANNIPGCSAFELKTGTNSAASLKLGYSESCRREKHLFMTHDPVQQTKRPFDIRQLLKLQPDYKPNGGIPSHLRLIM